MAVSWEESISFHFGARQSGKASDGARWFRDAASARVRAEHERDWIDAGVIAEPIVIDEDDVLAFTQAELAALQETAFAPGVEVLRIEGPHRVRIEIRAKLPCITSLR